MRQGYRTRSLLPFNHFKLNWFQLTGFIALAVILPNSVTQITSNPAETATFPTLQKSDIIFEDIITYKYRNLNRGDILDGNILLLNDRNMTKKSYIRRIIGLPGETLEIKKGTLYINNQLLKTASIPLPSNYSLKSTQLPADTYFVLGENPNYIKPELLGGFVTRKNIKGQVLFRLWPPKRFGLLNSDKE